MRITLNPTRVAAIATVNDVLLSSLKWHVGHTHGSIALIADAKHSITDIAMDVGALVTVERSVKVQQLFTIAVSLSLCVISINFIKDAFLASYQVSSQKIFRAVTIVQTMVVVTKESLFRVMRNISCAENSEALFAAAQHQRADVSISIGSAIAACLMACGFRFADRVCALAIGASMVNTARRLCMTMINQHVSSHSVESNAEHSTREISRDSAVGHS